MRGWLWLILLIVPVAQGATEIADLEEGANAVLVQSGLQKPVDIAFDGGGKLYYAAFESGELKEAATNRTVWTAPNLQLGGERGFVGLAARPDAEPGSAFYVFYQHNKSGTVVSRFSLVTDGTEQVLIDDIMAGLLHNSGRIAIGPDGLVYLSVGDAILDTAGRHKAVHAHDVASLNGKVLRLNPDGTAASGNPWGNAVWTKGHRNVYGLAVSPQGVVLGTENGPEKQDEINILVGGKDYGWPTCVGPCDKPEYTDPILSYEKTIAPTGAVWHEGHFYFTDFNKGTLHRVRPAADGSWIDERVLKFTTPRILDVAVGPDGLYLSTWDSLWRVVPAAVPVSVPTLEPGGAIGESRGVPAAPALLALLAALALRRGRG